MWEYTELTYRDSIKININDHNRLGRNGWEMVGVVNVGDGRIRFYFKRKVQ